MARRRLPFDGLPESGKCLRDARDALGLNTLDMGQLIGVSDSHLRNLELGKAHCGQSVIDGCAQASKVAPQSQAAVLIALTEQLQNIRDSESQQIDLGRGMEVKLRKPRRVAASAAPMIGPWLAIWQTSRNGKEAVVLETVEITASRGPRFKMRNLPDGRWLELQHAEDEEEPRHFEWEASCHVTVEHWVSGHFDSLSQQRAAGSFRLKLDNFPEVMVGNWLGISADSERTYAILVLARKERLAHRRFAEQRRAYPELPFAPLYPNVITWATTR